MNPGAAPPVVPVMGEHRRPEPAERVTGTGRHSRDPVTVPSRTPGQPPALPRGVGPLTPPAGHAFPPPLTPPPLTPPRGAAPPRTPARGVGPMAPGRRPAPPPTPPRGAAPFGPPPRRPAPPAPPMTTPARGNAPLRTPPRGAVPPIAALRPAVPRMSTTPPVRAAEPADTESPADGRRLAPALFTVLSLVLAPLVVAIAVLLLPAGSSADDRPVIQVLPRPQTTSNPAPAGQATDDPGTLVRP